MPDNIYRVDHTSTHGWQVRFVHRGRRLGRLFSDSHHGGREQAYEKACLYRDEIRSAIGDLAPSIAQITSRECRRKVWEAKTRTRTPGIGYTFQTHRSGLVTLFVQGFWRDPDGRWRSMKRSVDKHGLEKALDQVCKRVARGLQQGPAFGGRKRHLTAEALFNGALPALRDVADGQRAAA